MATPPVFTTGQVLTAAQMNQVGLWKLIPTSVAGTGVSLSGSNITMSGSGSAVSVNGVFSNDYRCYRIITNFTTSNVLYFRLRSSGTDDVNNNYRYAVNYQIYGSGVVQSWYGSGLSTNVVGYCDVNTTAISTFDVENPATGLPTNISGTAAWSTAGGYVAGYHTLFTSYDGFTLFAASGTLSGIIQVYGYK